MNIPPLTGADLVNSGMLRYYENLNPILQKGLVRYTTSEYSSLNTLLRDGLNPLNPSHLTSYKNEIDWINHLDNAISNSPHVNQPFYVYRGMVLSEVVTNYIKSNGYLNNLGYTSTTLDINTAMGFAGSSCCLFKIIIPDPQNINYTFIKTKTKGEQEVLFQRGTNFKLVKEPSIYKYYPLKSNDYKLISLYVVTINPGIVIPTVITMKGNTQPNQPTQPNQNQPNQNQPNQNQPNQNQTLESFTRYIEQMDPEDLDIFYNDNDDIPVEVVNDYIKTYPHHIVNDELKQIMIGIARQML